MNTVDFKQAGGFPLTQDTLNFMQEANVGSLGALAAALNTLCGSHYVILSGCTDNGNNVDGGFVAVHGEVMQFIGGQKTVNVRVVKEKTAVVFKDGSSKDVYTKQYVEFGSSSEQIPWSEFKRVPSSMPASDVYAWAKAATKPKYTSSEVGAAASNHTHTKGQITDFPTIPAAQIPSDWNQTDASKPDYIKNKPSSDLSTPWQASVGSSGTAYFRKDKVGMVELIIEIHGDTGDNIGYVPAGFAPNNPAMYDDYYITVVDTYSNAIASVRFWTNGMLERYYTDGGFGYGVIRQCYYPLT